MALQATSALDLNNEGVMYRALAALPGLTSLSVGHRPSLLRYHAARLRMCEASDGTRSAERARAAGGTARQWFLQLGTLSCVCRSSFRRQHPALTRRRAALSLRWFRRPDRMKLPRDATRYAHVRGDGRSRGAARAERASAAGTGRQLLH